MYTTNLNLKFKIPINLLPPNSPLSPPITPNTATVLHTRHFLREADFQGAATLGA